MLRMRQDSSLLIIQLQVLVKEDRAKVWVWISGNSLVTLRYFTPDHLSFLVLQEIF